MVLVKALLPLSPLIGASRATPCSNNTVIQWGTCEEDYGGLARVDCGRLYVPLDYTEPQKETLSLELLRAPASVQPAKGSILLNFGGPGVPARLSLAAVAPLLQM